MSYMDKPAPPVLAVGRSTIQGADLIAAYQATGRMVAVNEKDARTVSGMDRLPDEALEGLVHLRKDPAISLSGKVGAMARELLAHRRASQAAPAPSDGLREALEAIRDGYGPNHLSKFALAIASAALMTPAPAQEGDRT